MESAYLVFVCISAFVAVFVLLSVLAIVMRLILMVFPQLESSTDEAVIAAMTAVINKVYPGSHLSKIEEIK